MRCGMNRPGTPRHRGRLPDCRGRRFLEPLAKRRHSEDKDEAVSIDAPAEWLLSDRGPTQVRPGDAVEFHPEVSVKWCRRAVVDSAS